MNENLIPEEEKLEEINTNKKQKTEENKEETNKEEIEIQNEMDINDLTLPSENDIQLLMKKECRMNRTLIEEKREQAYICLNCPDSQKILCKYCIEECHKSHRGNTKIDKLKGNFVFFDKTPCQCALNDHCITQEYKNSLQKKETGAELRNSYCIFLPLFLSSNPKYYYKRKANGNIYCPFCMYNFQINEPKKEGSNFISMIKNIYQEQEDIIKFENISEEDLFNEKYEKVLYHGDQELNCTCMNNLHKHEIVTENIQSLTTFFFNELTEKINVEKIAFQLFHNNAIINQLLPDFMIIHQKIIECIENSKKKYEEEINIELEDKMEWDAYLQLTKLFNMFSYFLRNYKKCDVEIFNEEFNQFFSFETLNKLLSFKSNLEDKLFRIQVFSIKMYRRNLKFTILSQYFFVETNTSPLHRLLLRINYSNKQIFEEPLEIGKKVLELCELLEENGSIPQKEFTECFTEGLKIIKSVLPAFCNNIEELKDIFSFIQEKLSCVKEKRDGLNEVIRTLEKISEKIIIYINDNIILNNLLHVNDLYESNHVSQPYSFMSDNEFTKDIIETLFSFEIPINDTSLYIRANNFYDNLINSNDSYIEPLKNLAESTLSIQERKNCENIIDMLMGGPEIDLSDIDNIYNEITKNISSLLNNIINEEEYLETLNKSLRALSDITLTFTYIQQIGFYRNLHFHKLFNIMTLSHKIINYCLSIEDNNSEPKKKIEEISEKIHDNLKQIMLNFCRNNTFITPLVFEDCNIDLLLDKKTDNIDFYTITLKNMKESNYKINTLGLTTYICENYDLFRNFKNQEEKLITMLKLYKLILKLSSEKCLMEVNNLLTTKIKNLIETQDFRNLLTNLQTPMEQNIVIHTFKLFNNLQNEYIYLLNPSIPIIPIIEKLQEDTLPMNLRMIFSIVYTNYFVKSYFSINSIKDFFNEKPFTMNLIENLNLSMNQTELQMYLQEGDKMEKILKPIINNFENFRYFHTKYSSVFSEDFKFNLSFFKNVILLPTIYSIYKMTYFASEYSAILKYNIYRIVYLYLQCYKYILIFIMTAFDIQNGKTLEIWKKDLETDNIQNLVTIVSESVEYLESRNTQLLNINLILKHLCDNIKNFKIYKKIFKPEKIEIDKTHVKIKDTNKRDLLVIVPPVIEDYNEKKSNYEEYNIFHSIFIDEQKESLQRIIALDLLNRFVYPRDNQSTLNVLNLNRKAIKFGTIREPANRPQSSTSVLIGNHRRSIKDLTTKLKLQREKLDHLGTFYNPYISTFVENKSTIIESIDLCFKSNPAHWQDIVVDESNKGKELVNILINRQLPFLIQFIFIEFNRIDTVESPYYKNFINVLEFLRLFCEDHNPLFQTMYINYDKAIGTVDLEVFGKDIFIPFIFRIPILILENMKHSLEKVELLDNFRNFNFEYFNPLLEKVTDFLIEIIQGTYPENFEDLSTSTDEISHSGLELYFRKHYQFLDYVDSNSEYEGIISFFITYLNCFIEENSNPIRIKIPVILKLNPKKLLSVAINAFRKLIIKITGNQTIKSGCSNDLLELFIEYDEKLVDDPLFNISTGIFLYIQRINSFKDKALGDQIHQILNSLKELIYDPQAEEENSMKLLRKEYYSFCSTIIKKNEISFTEDKSKDEKEVYRYNNFFCKNFKNKVINFRNSNCSKKTNFENVFFMVHPDSLFLEQRDTISFLQKADYTNFNAKLNSILNYYSEIDNLIMMRKSLNNNKLLLFLFQIRYPDLEIVNAACAIFTNICLIYGKNNNFFSTVMIPFAFLHLIFLSALILNWYTFTYMKHLQLITEKENFWDFFSFIFSSMFNMEIFPFVATLLVGIPAILFKKFRFLFSLQLFPIFNIFDTIRSVLFSIKVRYKQFLSTAFLLVILILFYASVTLFYFRTLDDGTELCSSYLECFLYLFNYGIRAGGVPFNIKIDSQDGFWSEFVFSWVFYFIIILIVLNIINGIIVDTFQALREQNNLIDEEKTNVCFICSLHRSNFQIKGIDFDYHQQHEHNIENYFKYILKIRKTDEHDLNSIDFQVFNSIKQHKIEFFPIKKAKSLEN